MATTKRKTVDLPHWFICHPCATDRGGRWPVGHVATCHDGTCLYCKQTSNLAAINDYLWGGEKRLRSWD